MRTLPAVSLTADALRMRPQVPLKKLIKCLGREAVLEKIAEFEAEAEPILLDACEQAVAEIDDEAAAEEARARAAAEEARVPAAEPEPGAAAEMRGASAQETGL